MTSDRIRGVGSYAAARKAMGHLKDADFGPFKISVAMTRDNVEQLDEFETLAAHYGAQLRLTRLRPSGRGVDVWESLHPTAEQKRRLYRWLLKRPNVLTGDSFFHLSALGDPLDGLNLCGAGRVVCLIDPVGDVYACPFVIHDEFRAGNIRDAGFGSVWRESHLFRSLREPGSAGACSSCGSYDACRGGCMAAKFFTGLEMTDPDPECVFGHGEVALANKRLNVRPVPSPDHSRRIPVSISPQGAK
jgi:mycofactocin radical SAM maturase